MEILSLEVSEMLPNKTLQLTIDPFRLCAVAKSDAASIAAERRR